MAGPAGCLRTKGFYFDTVLDTPVTLPFEEDVEASAPTPVASIPHQPSKKFGTHSMSRASVLPGIIKPFEPTMEGTGEEASSGSGKDSSGKTVKFSLSDGMKRDSVEGAVIVTDDPPARPSPTYPSARPDARMSQLYLLFTSRVRKPNIWTPLFRIARKSLSVIFPGRQYRRF
jgi:hypothetical protein